PPAPPPDGYLDSKTAIQNKKENINTGNSAFKLSTDLITYAINQLGNGAARGQIRDLKLLKKHLTPDILQSLSEAESKLSTLKSADAIKNAGKFIDEISRNPRSFNADDVRSHTKTLVRHDRQDTDSYDDDEDSWNDEGSLKSKEIKERISAQLRKFQQLDSEIEKLEQQQKLEQQ
ncbi:hypothetical protein, partial [Burkholderia cepacia]|uniref:hypothetical protein n=1 Tax=Burkholderia cepacia TaxID=292 RepID=UPI0018B08B31